MKLSKIVCIGAVVAGLGMLPGGAAQAAPDGAELFQGKCALCHGKTGQPKPAFAKRGVKSLRDPEWQEASGDDAIRKVIREGSKGTLMRSYEKQLSAEEIDALVAFIRTLKDQAD